MAEHEQIGDLENKVSLELVKEIHVSSSGDIVFHFNLPKEGLALRSVGIVDSMPEFRFDTSYAPNVPTITEEDVATVFRLVEEGKRPEFFYLNFPPTHPLFLSRKFKQYSPPWLRGTEFGEALAEADWKMKCLHVGTKTNKDKTVFGSWSQQSNLDALATRLDFPKVANSGSIIMSCESAKLQKSDNEILFPEEPKMKITDQCSPLYTKYITEIFESIAYYDEPTFLKMQELIKLILAVEWLYNEKGVRVNHAWMMEHTRKAKKEDGHLELSTRKKSPCAVMPLPKVFKRPSSEVSVKTREAEMNNKLAKCGVQRHYGYYDFGNAEMAMFKEDGTPCLRLKCLKLGIEEQSSVSHQSILGFTQWRYLPCPGVFEPSALRDALLMQSKSLTFPIPLPVHVATTVDDSTDETGVELKITHSIHPRPPLVMPPMKQTTVLKATVDNFNKLYANEDPNTPIRPEIPGVCKAIIPDVGSWDELFSELSVPIPRVWQVPFFGVGEPTASGGVTTRNFKVEEEALPRRVVRDQLTVVRGFVKGTIRLVGRDQHEFTQVSSKFSIKWTKGSCPQIAFVFAITNHTLEQKWTSYGQNLRHQHVEEYYHGTELACDITTSHALCTKGNCGICGISSDGLNPQCIKKDGTFQRFGPGFYLAPNSSKCNDYTTGANGYRAMLQCDVYPGQKYNLKTNDQNLTGPPRGYDSVYGQVGSKLNYPEIVVYRQHAVMPRYIIVY